MRSGQPPVGGYPPPPCDGERGKSLRSEENGAQSSRNFLLLGGGDAVEKGQRECAPGNGFSDRQRGRARAGMAAPGGLQMDGSKVARGGDATAGKLSLHVIAADEFRQTHHVDEPAYGAARESERREFEAWNAVEKRVVSRSGSLAESEHLSDAAELHTSQRASQFREPVVVTDLSVVEPACGRLTTLIAQTAQTIGMSAVVSQHCAAFAGGELLVGIEAKYCHIAKAAGAVVVEFGADGLTGVFNEDKAVTAGEITERVHIGRNAKGVDNQNGAGARRDGAGHGGGIEVEGDGVNLGKDGRGANLENCVGHGHKCKGGHDYLVAFADAEREQSEMETGGAGADGYGIGHGVISGQGGFKGWKLGSKAEVRRTQNCGDGIDFGLRDVRRG